MVLTEGAWSALADVDWPMKKFFPSMRSAEPMAATSSETLKPLRALAPTLA